MATDLGTLSGTVIDNGDGTYTETLTSSVTVGTATITGTVNAEAITDNATVDFTSAGGPWWTCAYLYRDQATITAAARPFPPATQCPSRLTRPTITSTSRQFC